jgi:hypothetical protein
VQDFLSYGRLVKPTKESGGKILGHSGRKIGNAHLKWAFSEAAVCFLRGNRRAQALRARLAAKHGKGKSLSIIAARLARAVYFMLKRRTPFDTERFFAHSGSAGTKGSSLNVLTGAAVQGARPEPNSLCPRAPQPSLAASGCARQPSRVDWPGASSSAVRIDRITRVMRDLPLPRARH